MAPSVAQSLRWIDSGTAFLLDYAPDLDVAAPSALPDWTNGHVLAHISRNAEAIGRLATWVRTGVEQPMYASPDRRAADIEAGATRGIDAQLADIRATAAAMDAELANVTDDQWAAGSVRLLTGRVLTGPDVPWLRVKELWLHAVDMGAAVDDLPPDLLVAVLEDVVTYFDARDDTPSLRLVTSDGNEYLVHDGALEVRGRAADLLSWLIGRADGATLETAGELPAVPKWM